MAVGPVRERDVVAGLGWPEKVTPDDHVGWPRVPRETLRWASEASALRPAVTAPADPTPASSASPVASTATAPDEVVIRAPGPRRAHFDIDEQGLPPLPDAEEPVSRETAEPAVLPVPSSTRVFVVANQKGGV